MQRAEIEQVKEIARQIAKEEIALAIINLPKEVAKEAKAKDEPADEKIITYGNFSKEKK